MNFDRLNVPASEVPSSKFIDVTLRDGGFHTSFDWRMDEIVCITRSASSAGADYVELGYIGGVPELHGVERIGLSADLSAEAIRTVSETVPSARLAAMVHPGSNPLLDFGAYRNAGLALVRLVYHPNWRPELERLAAEARSSGLAVSINLALASHYTESQFLAEIEAIAGMRPEFIYIADTCAALLPGEVGPRFSTAGMHKVPLGFHAHDHLSCALTNSFEAIRCGATIIDGSFWGLGRGAGNLRAELWFALQVARGNSRYRLLPLIEGLELVASKLDMRRPSDLASIVCGAMNLLPPQETALRKSAIEHGISADRLAALLCESAHRFESLTHALLALGSDR